jgi:hypothetical protein
VIVFATTDFELSLMEAMYFFHDLFTGIPMVCSLWEHDQLVIVEVNGAARHAQITVDKVSCFQRQIVKIEGSCHVRRGLNEDRQVER